MAIERTKTDTPITTATNGATYDPFQMNAIFMNRIFLKIQPRTDMPCFTSPELDCPGIFTFNSIPDVLHYAFSFWRRLIMSV